jgi:hypothetical protein
MASRLVRAKAVTVTDVLDGHKLLVIDCVDRTRRGTSGTRRARRPGRAS